MKYFSIVFSFFKKIIVNIFRFIHKLIYDMTYENGKPSKGYIGFWVSFGVIVLKFIQDGADIPTNWLTLILAFLAYNGVKKPVDAYTTSKATSVQVTNVTNNQTTARNVKDSDDPVN